MKTLYAVLLASAVLPAAAQTQTPAPAATAPAAEAPKPRPPLKLRLDDAALRSLTPPTDTEKKPDDGLPTLGGRPSSEMERKASEVVPKDTAKGL